MIGKGVFIIWVNLEKQKTEVHIFDKVSFSCFTARKFQTKEDIVAQKQVLLLNLRLWHAQKPNILVIFYVERFMQEISVL